MIHPADQAQDLVADQAKFQSHKQPILIYRDRLLPYSETFIPAQVEAMSRYQGHYVGVSREASGLENLPSDRLFLLEDHAHWPKISKTAFRFAGLLPRAFEPDLRALRPRLIHAHFGPDGVFAGAIARQLKLPLVVTFHGYDAALQLSPEQAHPSPAQQLNQLLYHRGTFYRRRYVEQRSRLFAQAAQIIAVSDCIRGHLLAQGCPEHKIKVHYIGIDRQQFQPAPEIPREPVVLFVGRLVEKKGCGLLLEAMRSVQQLHPQVSTVVIGDGFLRADLERRSQQLGLRVRFLGRQSTAVVRQWMNRARIFCVPSQMTAQQDVEGLGMVFAEAQAMGLPVVSFASGGVPEVVLDDITGLLAPERDTEALGKALHRLLEDGELWGKMAIAGQHHIANRFDLAKNTPLLEAIYEGLLQG